MAVIIIGVAVAIIAARNERIDFCTAYTYVSIALALYEAYVNTMA